MGCWNVKLKRIIILSCILALILLSGCSSGQDNNQPIKKGNGSRDNTPIVLEPQASNEKTIGNNKITFDISHASDGYVMVKYNGSNPKVKVRILTPTGEYPYTYNVYKGYNVYPLTGGNGSYTFLAFENVSGSDYNQLFSESLDIQIKNEYTPYLYPNQYVHYDKNSNIVKMGQELATGADTDLDVVSYIYDYIIHNITYDDDKANQVKQGQLTDYLPNVDEILKKKTGICFDYAAVMTAMLRTQNIPTRMTTGYVTVDGNTVFHAWLSVYIKDVGWIDDIIQFDGKNWSMMDPTFIADGNNSSTAKEFVKNKDNYIAKYLY